MMTKDFTPEFVFNASRSSGAGGQNVNKVNTKVELRFNLRNSQLLSDEDKSRIEDRLANRINDNGELILVSQTERSQLKNKEKVIEKFYALLEKALAPVKKRTPTRPTKASKTKRLEKKQNLAEKKSRRRRIDYE